MKKPNKWLNKKAIIFAACIAALAALLAILNLAQPSLEMIEAGIPPSFEEGAGTRFAKAETNYLAFRIVRASNLRTAEKLTFIGFAGKVFEIAPDTFASGVADVLFWLPALMRGTRITVSLTIVSVAAGLVASVFLALGKISRYKALSKMCGAYIFFFRGTPLLMQLFFVYYALPEINPALTINNKFAAAFIAFAMNSSAYCAEIIRAAIQSIDKGQFEAAQTLGHSYAQTMSLIIIPQAIRRLIPPVANEFIMVLKDASLVSIIALTDLTHVTRSISSSSSTALVYIPAMGIYLVITAFFTYIFNKLESHFSVYQ